MKGKIIIILGAVGAFLAVLWVSNQAKGSQNVVTAYVPQAVPTQTNAVNNLIAQASGAFSNVLSSFLSPSPASPGVTSGISGSGSPSSVLPFSSVDTSLTSLQAPGISDPGIVNDGTVGTDDYSDSSDSLNYDS